MDDFSPKEGIDILLKICDEFRLKIKKLCQF
jgi:hypothetical protein